MMNSESSSSFSVISQMQIINNVDNLSCHAPAYRLPTTSYHRAFAYTIPSAGMLLGPLCTSTTFLCLSVSPPQKVLCALPITSNSLKRTHSTMSSFVALVTIEIASLPQHLWPGTFCLTFVFPVTTPVPGRQ